MIHWRLHRTCPSHPGSTSQRCQCCCHACYMDGNCGDHNRSHASCQQPVRFFWWTAKGADMPWWRLVNTTGVHGGDEFCNRNVGIRLPGGMLFITLEWHLWYDCCDECLGFLMGVDDLGDGRHHSLATIGNGGTDGPPARDVE